MVPSLALGFIMPGAVLWRKRHPAKMPDVLDIPVVTNIPPIHIGATWRSFRLDFFRDEALTQPFNLTGLPLKSQIHYLDSDRRVTVLISPGATSNQLIFILPHSITAKLAPGWVNWDVFVQELGNIDVIAIGQIEIETRATVWSLGPAPPGPVVVPSGIQPRAYQITIATNGQTIINLPVPITDATRIGVYLNGSRQVYGRDWTATNTVLTWLATDFTLATTDKMEIVI